MPESSGRRSASLLSRRDFVRYAGLSGAFIALGACASPAPVSSSPANGKVEDESPQKGGLLLVGTRQEPTGPVETFSIEVAAETVTRDIETEDAAVILLRFANGARGSVSISQISAGRKNSLQYEIDGSRSSVAWDSEQPDQIWFGHRERPNEILLKNPALMGPAGRAAAALPGGHVEGFADTFGAHFRAIYADVAAGRPADRPVYATFADGHDEMLVNDAIARSAREGRWVEVVRDAPSPAHAR